MRKFILGLLFAFFSAVPIFAADGESNALFNYSLPLTGAGAGSGVASRTALVATRQSIPNSINGNVSGISDFGTIATEDLRNGVKVALANFTVKGNGQANEVGPGGPITVACGIQYPAGVGQAAVGQCLFSGSATTSVANNTYIVSDAFNLTTTIPAGQKFVVRIYNNGGATHFPDDGTAGRVSNGTYFDKECVGAAVTDLTNSSTALSNASTGGSCVTTRVIPALAVLGPTTKATAVIAADSIGYGYLDTQSPDYLQGIIARGFSASSTPFLSLASGGGSVACWRYNNTSDCSAGGAANYATNRLSIIAAGWGSTLISNLGTNDFHILGGAAITNIEANLTWLYGQAPAGTRIIQTTITPKTGSSDSWTTVAGQSQNDCSPTCATSAFTIFNTHVRTNAVSGQHDNFDVAGAVINDPVTPDNKWLGGGTTFYCAQDSINHPSVFCYGQGATAVSTAKLR